MLPILYDNSVCGFWHTRIKDALSAWLFLFHVIRHPDTIESIRE